MKSVNEIMGGQNITQNKWARTSDNQKIKKLKIITEIKNSMEADAEKNLLNERNPKKVKS